MTHQKNIDEPSKYILFDTSILDDLNHRQAIMMGIINGLAKKSGYAYIKNATICKLLKCSESSVKKDLQVLENLGYIRREVNRNEKNVVIERRIYIMVKIYTEVGVKSTPTLGVNSDPPGGKISPIDKNKYINIIDKEYLNPFLEWLEYKHEIKNPYKTDRSVKTLANKMMKETTPSQFKQAVELSIMNGWKGLFPDKVKNVPSQGKLPKATLDD